MAESISKVAGSAAVVAEQILDMDSDVSSDDEQSDWEPSQNSRGSEVDDEIAAQEEEIAGLLSERDSNMEENGAETQESPKKRVRKRQRNPSKWKVNVRKRLCQSGKKYTNVRGKEVPEKQVKNHKDCADKCKYRCVMAITEEQRESIFLEFYKLDQSTKYSFIASTSKCTQTARPKGGPSRRKKSFSYNFVVDGKEIRVCKQYYLGTLSISQKMVYTVHEKANPITGTPKPDGRGKYPKKVINNERKQAVMDHIKSFPVVESHYCRASTKKQYLEPQLNIQKMYDMYQETCEQQHLQPVKCSYYRHIFDTEFNYSFHKPKSDRCDRCEEYKISSKEGLLNDELTAEYQAHIEEKNAMRTERQEDRHDKNCLVICFDLENVITCPKADTSCFFYKRKLNVYSKCCH